MSNILSLASPSLSRRGSLRSWTIQLKSDVDPQDRELEYITAAVDSVLTKMGGIDWAAYEYRWHAAPPTTIETNPYTQSHKRYPCSHVFFSFGLEQSVLDNQVIKYIFDNVKRVNSLSFMTVIAFPGCPAKCPADGNWRLGWNKESNQPSWIDSVTMGVHVKLLIILATFFVKCVGIHTKYQYMLQ